VKHRLMVDNSGFEIPACHCDLVKIGCKGGKIVRARLYHLTLNVDAVFEFANLWGSARLQRAGERVLAIANFSLTSQRNGEHTL